MGEKERQKGEFDYSNKEYREKRKRAKEEGKEYLVALSLELEFIRTFLKYAAPRCIQYQNLKPLIMRAQDLLPKASMILVELFALQRSSVLLERLMAGNDAAGHTLNEAKLLNSEIARVYRILSRFHSPLSNDRLMKFIDSLLHNMKDLSLSWQVEVVGSFGIELEALEGKLRFLRKSLMFIVERCSDQQKLMIDLFAHAKFVVDNAADFCHSYFVVVSKMDEDAADKLASEFSQLMRRFEHLCGQIYIRVLQASLELPSRDFNTDTVAVELVKSLVKDVMELLCAGWTVPMRDKIQILLGELAFLRSFLMDHPLPHPDGENWSSVFLKCKIICTKVGLMVDGLFDYDMNHETYGKVYSSSLVSLLQELELIRAEIKEAIFVLLVKPPCPQFPRTDELASYDRFLQNLSELLNNKTSSITCLNLPIEPLLEEMQFLRSFLSKIADRNIEQEKLKVLWSRIMEVACFAEYIVDSLLVGNGPAWCLVLWLSDVMIEIEVLKAEVRKIGEKEVSDNNIRRGEENSEASLLTSFLELSEAVIGFEDVEESIIEDLLEGSTKLQVVAIVGMPGQGKTHLAKRIYNHPTVRGYFYVSAWCYISQVYDKKSLLHHILKHVEPQKTFEKTEKEEEELAESLYKSLKGKRYFILMDDLWDVNAWNELRRSFPNDNNGSRIMFTSRFQNSYLKVSGINIHQLRAFSDHESWQLLQEKVFQSQNCPPKLLEVGKQIAKDCNGLPLAIVVVAGILARIDKNQYEWSKVANSLSSYIVGEPEKKCIKVIELSYKHLPDYLKPCFLYIGALVKYKHIRVQKLICLWIAEGFVLHKVEERKSLEDIAEEYLIDLIDRSLIIVMERRSIGDIRKCRAHDLVRDFCLLKAQEDNFFCPTESTDIMYTHRRISCKELDCIMFSKGYQPVRSLQLFNHHHYCWSSKISSMCDRFKLLSVLNLKRIWILNPTFPEGILSLTLLRYLAISGELELVPPSISNLCHLETLIVKCRREFRLPHTIWKMIKLRYLKISSGAILDLPQDGVSQLDNLHTFSTLLLTIHDNTIELMKGLANVKHLKCSLFISPVYSGNHNWLQGLATLTQLQSLTLCLTEEGSPINFSWLDNYDLSLPSSLKKLTINGEFNMPWNKISVIGKLPNLEVLKLLDGAFKGEEWNMIDNVDQFSKLKFLKFRCLNIGRWSIMSNECFPPLEQLVLQACCKLKEIPCCLEDIPTLKVIQVIDCNPCLDEVLKQIQDEQLDMGNQINVVLEHNTKREYDTSDEDIFVEESRLWRRERRFYGRGRGFCRRGK